MGLLYKASPITTLPEVLKEIISNNKFLCINGKPLFRSKLLRKGFRSVSDLLTESGKMKSWSTLQNHNVTGAEYFILYFIRVEDPLKGHAKYLARDTRTARFYLSRLFQKCILGTRQKN